MSERITPSIGGMSESAYDLSTLQTIRDEGLGNYTVLFVGPWDNAQVERVAAFCRENGYRFVMDERINRLTGKLTDGYQAMDHGELASILNRYRDCCDGSLLMCEFGGLMLYWPRSTVEGSPMTIAPTDDFAAAEQDMIDRLRRVIADSRNVGVTPPLISIEASGVMARWLYRAGIDRVDLEITYHSRTELFYSAAKGATLAYNKERFGVDMAMVWYGGHAQHDELWFHRWRMSLYHAFLRGANPIYAEHGLMNFHALGKRLDADAPEVRRFRSILGEFAQVARAHPRPAGFPQARIAVIQGHLDGYAGLTQTHVWGQRQNDAMKLADAEASWNLFQSFYQRLPWEYRHAYADTDASGNPPLGQVDVIPAEAPLSLLRQYDCLLFLGWNTMTPELYAKLTSYVHGGGHLLCTLAHLNTAASRQVTPRLVNDGDLGDLFGVAADISSPRRLSYGVKFRRDPSAGRYRFPLRSQNCDPEYCDGGFPMAALTLAGADVLAVGSDRFIDKDWPNSEIVLTAHRHGRGMAMLLNSLAYPGHPGVRPFYQDLLHRVAAAWQEDLRIVAGDRVRYATYALDEDKRLYYFLNTEESLHQEVCLGGNAAGRTSIQLRPGELKSVLCHGDQVLRLDSLTHAAPANPNQRGGPIKT